MPATSFPYRLLLTLLCACAALFSFAANAQAAPKVNLNNGYVIQISLEKKPVDPKALPALDAFRDYRLYQTSFTKGGTTWYRLRLGFFPDMESAEKVRRTLLSEYADAWITRVGMQERKDSAAGAIEPRGRATRTRDAKPEPKGDGIFAVQLWRGTRAPDPAHLPDRLEFKQHRLYVEEQVRGDTTYYQLRVGFFDSSAEAAPVQRALSRDFPGAWVTEVTKKERRSSRRSVVKPEPRTVARAATPKPAPTATPKPAPAADPQPAPAANVAPSVPLPKGNFAIQLRQDSKPITAAGLPDLPEFARYLLYVHKTRSGNRTRYQLRLGFFAEKPDALRIQQRVATAFPGAWVTEVSEAERVAASAHAVTPRTVAPVAVADAPKGDEALLKKLMDDARRAMVDSDYDTAVRLYTKVLRFADHPYQQDALEYLGLARERKGQFAHAKQIYTDFLERYPDGDAAARVRQRLAGIITAAGPGQRQELRKVTRAQGQVHKDFFGGLSQYYRRDVTTDPTGVVSTDLSLLNTDLDLTWRRRSDRLDFRSRITTGYRRDFANQSNSEGRLTAAYVDAQFQPTRTNLRVGRQTLSTSGVLGRFDGTLLRQNLGGRLKVNLVRGYPVEISTGNTINRRREFNGVSVDIGTLFNHLDMNLFKIEQTVDGISDRDAVGGELRFFSERRSFFTLVDYDRSYQEYNTIMFVGNWRFKSETTLNLVLDYRKSPVLTTTNALQGMVDTATLTPITTIEQLLTLLTEDQVRQAALDHTPLSRSLTLGGTKPLSKKTQISADITATKLSATPGTIGDPTLPGAPIKDIPGMPESGPDYFYNLQFITSGLLQEGDITILGARLADTDFTRTLTFTANSRFQAGPNWRFNPRLRLDLRDDLRNNAEETVWRPELRLDWRAGRNMRFELEGGQAWSSRKIAGATEKTETWFIALGYRIDF
ncbi:MAG: SPOR domain-containing protein [Nitrospirota bacterium]|nr:SPOR domain-containing protein [Nitrospirota bacterium]